MKSLSHSVALLFAVLLALIPPVAGAQDTLEPIDTPEYLRFTLDRPVHFRTSDGEAAPLGAGAYLAVVSRSPPLRLLPLAAGSRPWALEAEVSSHEEKLDAPSNRRKLRREIARIRTIRREREIGIERKIAE